jgi:hypothetical protein
LGNYSGKSIQVADSVLDGIRARPSTVRRDGTTISFKIPEERMGYLPKVEVYFPPGSGWNSQNLDLDEITPWYMFWKSDDRKKRIDHFLKTIEYGNINIKRMTPGTPTSNSTLGMERVVVPATP